MTQELARLGQIIDAESDPRADRIDDLERQVARLRGDLSDARHELTRVKEDSNRALTSLRQQLSPLYRSLQRVFGELDDAGVPEAGPEQPASRDTTRTSAVWESWKSRLGGGCAKAIDALLTHSDLNTQQLAIATGLHRTTIPKIIFQLNKAGLINKNSGRFSLKAL